MLAEVGLLTANEAEQIVAALDDIALPIECGEMAFSIELEDIHTHIEQARSDASETPAESCTPHAVETIRSSRMSSSGSAVRVIAWTVC